MNDRWKAYPRAQERERAGERSQERDWLVEYLRVKPFLTVREVFGELAGFQTINGNLHGPCPLHGGPDSSFVIDPQTLRWRCYSECRDGGDALEFLHRLNGHRLRGQAFLDLIRAVCERVQTAPRNEPCSRPRRTGRS
jgi:CHC2 zinc finger